jgi:polysaccharide biosynthesis transport protein
MDKDNSSELTFKDYIAVVKRRGMLFAGIGAPILTIGIALAFGLPPVYESSALLLAEQSEVPEYLVRSTIPNFPDERVRRITDRVLTEDNLAGIIERRDPYPELSAQDPDSAVREMRRNLITGAEDPALLRELLGSSDNIAFRIGFSHSSPETARGVASDLMNLYLTENQRARQELATETLGFLTAQATRLEREIAAKEVELAAFKRDNAGRLPELSNMNMQLLDRTERDLEAVEAEIRMLRERVTLIESELGQLSPYAAVVDEQGMTLLSPADRLKMLQRQYAQASSRYSQDHPDIARLRREIDALSAQTGLPGIDRSVLETTLSGRLQELESARERWSADHPDVIRIEMAVQNLRDALAEAPRTANRAAAVAPPDNPLYIQRQVQLQGARIELDAALQRREELRGRLTGIETRLTSTPEVEREYSSLSRGYEQLVAQYSEVQTKQREAEIAVNLESESKGERFRVLRSPGLPSLPAQPNRIAILLLGFALAFAAGAGGVAVAEVSDTTVRAPRDVHRLLEIPPLVMIPYIDNEADIRGRRWKRLAAAATFVAWIGVTAFFIVNPAG